MKLMTGYEFWWTPTFCSVIQLQKSVFISKISNPSFRNRFPFYRKFPRNARIVLRSCRSEHDGPFDSNLILERLKIVARFVRNRAPIFYETTCLNFTSQSCYDPPKSEHDFSQLQNYKTVFFPTSDSCITTWTRPKLHKNCTKNDVWPSVISLLVHKFLYECSMLLESFFKSQLPLKKKVFSGLRIFLLFQHLLFQQLEHLCFPRHIVWLWVEGSIG